MKQFFKFGIVGAVGFLVDASILLLCVHILSFSIEVSRLISFMIAVFVTWLINRSFTFFKSTIHTKKKEYFYYFTIQTLGAFLNYLIFIVLVYKFDIFENYLIFPLAIASVLVMFFNFFFIKRFVFVKK